MKEKLNVNRGAALCKLLFGYYESDEAEILVDAEHEECDSALYFVDEIGLIKL